MSKLSFREILETTILNSSISNSYTHTYHHQKYELRELLDDIIYVLKTGISWRNIRGNIRWQSLAYHFNKFCEANIFNKSYKKLLKIYKRNMKKADIIYLTDTSFIKNNVGISNLGRNVYFKNKRCFKLSFLTDIHGIPMDILVDAGNLSEKEYLNKHIKYILKNKSSKKTILMADKGYDSSFTRKTLIENNIYPIIPYNKRNTKDETKIKHLNDDDKKLYRKRIRIENLFSWIKKKKRISEINEKTTIAYLNFVYLASGIILSKRMHL